MPYDPDLARAAYARLDDLPGLSERKMFGGLCFMQHGNMICGVNDGGYMIRVGKDAVQAALALPDVEPMQMGAKTMGGYVSTSFDTDEGVLDQLFAMAIAFVRGLPPK